MIVDCISDLHGHYPKLEGGDLLIVAGDLTARDTVIEYQTFKAWLLGQNYKKKIVIAGNHDNYLAKPCDSLWIMPGLEYLCDSGTEFLYWPKSSPKGEMMCGRSTLKIWGSPWTLRFPGMNPHCMAFTVDTEEELAEKWALIPDDVDILVTHSPPFGIGDKNLKRVKCGSKSLYDRLIQIKPRVHIFGHIHECGHKYYHIKYPIEIEQLPTDFLRVCVSETHCVNASHVNASYEPVNKPIRIEL